MFAELGSDCYVGALQRLVSAYLWSRSPKRTMQALLVSYRLPDELVLGIEMPRRPSAGRYGAWRGVFLVFSRCRR